MLSTDSKSEIGRASEVVGTVATLFDELLAVGIRMGDTVFVHSSLRSLGPLENGAATVMEALETAVGSSGLVLMPSFHLVEKSLRAKTWDRSNSPSTTGWLTEYFRRMPGTFRSDHYSHSVAARGHRAREWVSGDEASTKPMSDNSPLKSPWDLEPWMGTFDQSSPLYSCYEHGAKVLMIGTSYHELTFMHLVEVMDWNRRLTTDPGADYRWIDREAAGCVWDADGILTQGKVGNAACRLFSVREFVDAMLVRVASSPSLFKSFQSSVTT